MGTKGACAFVSQVFFDRRIFNPVWTGNSDVA